MGLCCCKEENQDDIPTQDIIYPFTIIKSKEEIAYSPNAIFIGLYPVDDLLVYVYSNPVANGRPNKFLISHKVIEVLCEQNYLNTNMIIKQVKYIRKNYYNTIV